MRAADGIYLLFCDKETNTVSSTDFPINIFTLSRRRYKCIFPCKISLDIFSTEKFYNLEDSCNLFYSASSVFSLIVYNRRTFIVTISNPSHEKNCNSNDVCNHLITLCTFLQNVLNKTALFL